MEERPVKSSIWRYYQSLGLGYYEYFQLCEDIGAIASRIIPAGFDMTFAEVKGAGYYIWPKESKKYIQKVDPFDPTVRLGQVIILKDIGWPFEYGKHNIHNTDQGVMERLRIL